MISEDLRNLGRQFADYAATGAPVSIDPLPLAVLANALVDAASRVEILEAGVIATADTPETDRPQAIQFDDKVVSLDAARSERGGAA